MGAFGRYNPFVTVIYFASVLLIAMFTGNPIIQLTALAGGICFSIAIGRRGGFGLYFITFCLITLTNPLFSHNGVTPLFFLNGNAITLEAIYYGIALAVMVCGVIIWFGCFTEIMTSDKLTFIFGRAWARLSLVISMALRFVPMFTIQAKRVWRTQKAMGLTDDGFIGKIKIGLKVFSAVTAWAFENAIDTAASMKARGYGIGKRTSFGLFKFGVRDGMMALVIIVLSVICISGVLMGKAEFDYYPAISGIDTSAGAIIVYIFYGILAFLPFIIELKEALVWRYCVSKI